MCPNVFRLVMQCWIYAESRVFSMATFYKCRVKYGTMDVSMISSMYEQEDKSRRINKMYRSPEPDAEIWVGSVLKELTYFVGRTNA